MNNKKRCFVLMPFDPKLREVYDKIYIPACKKHRVYCTRADESHTPGIITTDIINKILDADFIIADLTSENANVFYELGFAHTIRKPVILTTQQSLGDIPFDIRPVRVIPYTQPITDDKMFFNQLGSAISEVLNTSPEIIDNPIGIAMWKRNLVFRDASVVMLDNEKLKNIIKLHKRSVKYLCFILIDDALIRMDAGVFVYDLEAFTNNLYHRIVESSMLCDDLSARGIKNVQLFLKDQFKIDELRELVMRTEHILLPDTGSREDRRIKGQNYVRNQTTEIFERIEAEIDRLNALPDGE